MKRVTCPPGPDRGRRAGRRRHPPGAPAQPAAGDPVLRGHGGHLLVPDRRGRRGIVPGPQRHLQAHDHLRGVPLPRLRPGRRRRHVPLLARAEAVPVGPRHGALP